MDALQAVLRSAVLTLLKKLEFMFVLLQIIVTVKTLY